MDNHFTHFGHRHRIKEKYQHYGIIGWNDYEILEFALSYALPRLDTKPLAKRLLEEFKSFGGVLSADIQDLMKVKGVGQHSALFLRLLKDVAEFMLLERTRDIDVIDSPDSAYEYLKIHFIGKCDEVFVAIFLNNRNAIICIEEVQTGTVNEAIVYPRKVVERALHHHAVGVIISHNHPSGSLEPSKHDQEVTLSIKNALETINIELLDHIIIAGKEYYSFSGHEDV
ncbi:DNA repair protein RadC [bacterium]